MCEPPSKSSVCAWCKSIGYRFFWRGLSFYSVLFKLTPNNTKNGTKILFIKISKISFTKDFLNEFFFTCLVFWKRIYPSSRVPFSTKVIARLSLSVIFRTPWWSGKQKKEERGTRKENKGRTKDKLNKKDNKQNSEFDVFQKKKLYFIRNSISIEFSCLA